MSKDFNTSILVDQSPEEAFNAVNNVRGWWSEEIEGETDKLNAVFDYHFEDVHRCKMRITELVPNKRVIWQVLDNYFKFTEDETEWKDTQMIFEISEKDGKTLVHVTHLGLVPELECYDTCRKAWTQYIGQSLYNLITTGKGQPNATNKPQTEDEKGLAARR